MRAPSRESSSRPSAPMLVSRLRRVPRVRGHDRWSGASRRRVHHSRTRRHDRRDQHAGADRAPTHPAGAARTRGGRRGGRTVRGRTVLPPARRSWARRNTQPFERPEPGRRLAPADPGRPEPLHQVLALRAHLRRGAGPVHLAHRAPGGRFPDRSRRGQRVGRQLLRLVWCVRRHLSEWRARGPELGRCGTTDGLDPHDLSLLRRRLRAAGRDARRDHRADHARARRAGQPWSLVRQGALRLRLQRVTGSGHATDGPRRRAVASGLLVRRRRPRRRRVPAHHRPRRTGRSRRPRLGPSHQRGQLSRPEARASRARDQQRRLLRAGVPRAQRGRPEPDVRHRGSHQLVRRHRARRRRSSSAAPTRPRITPSSAHASSRPSCTVPGSSSSTLDASSSPSTRTCSCNRGRARTCSSSTRSRP